MLRISNAFARALLSAGVFLFPASILVVPDFGEALFRLMAVAGVLYCMGEGVAQHVRDRIRLLSILTLGFFFAALLSACVSFEDMTGFMRLQKSAHFLATPFIAALFIKLNVSARFMLVSVKAAALLAFFAALVHYLPAGARAGGAVNALVFGYLALLLGFFSLIRYPLELPEGRFISVLAFFSGCTAAVLSQSRGAWIAALLLLPGMLLYWWRAGVLSRHITLQVSGLFVALVLLVSSLSFVQQRAGSAMAEYHSCQASGECAGSVGQRLLMWESGLRAAMQRPLLGWGLHRTQQAAVAQLDDTVIKRGLLNYTHLHNEYINTLVGKGMVGLLSLLLMLVVPFILFLNQHTQPRLLVVNGIGCLLCAGYALAGLSNLAFGHEIMNTFFIYFLALVLPMRECARQGVSASRCSGAER